MKHALLLSILLFSYFLSNPYHVHAAVSRHSPFTTSQTSLSQDAKPTISKNEYHQGLLRNQTTGLLLIASSLYGIGTFLVTYDLLKAKTKTSQKITVLPHSIQTIPHPAKEYLKGEYAMYMVEKPKDREKKKIESTRVDAEVVEEKEKSIRPTPFL